MFTRGSVHAPVRQRKSPKKDDGASPVEPGEVDRARKGAKKSGKGNPEASDGRGYDSSQRLRSFSVSDDEEKRVKMVKSREKHV